MASDKTVARYYVWHLMWTGGQCEADVCQCPHGRSYFETAGPWVPSPDRYPVPGRLGGAYSLDNVRLTHQNCNKADGGRVGGSSRSDAKVNACRENWTKADLTAAGNNPNSRNLSHADQVRGGAVGRCKRWNINRGLACVCGSHQTA